MHLPTFVCLLTYPLPTCLLTYGTYGVLTHGFRLTVPRVVFGVLRPSGVFV